MRWFVVVGGIGAVCLALLGWAWYGFRSPGAFPNLVQGAYVGTFSIEHGGASYPWSVVKETNSEALAVFVGDIRIQAQRVDVKDPSGKTRLPLIIGSSDARLRFTGNEVSPGEYAGEFINPISNEKGSWRLRKVPSDSIAAGLEDDLTRWYALWQELDGLEGEIHEAQVKADQHRSAVDSLHQYVSDGDTLKKTASERLGRADSQIDSLRGELIEQRSLLDQKIRDFELAQRISPEGALVFLSRQTIQRESRWIELTLKLLAPGSSPEFQQAIEKAQRVKTLQREINQERSVARKPSAEGSPGTPKRETESEEEFYGQMQ